jgi:hypothetical protein
MAGRDGACPSTPPAKESLTLPAMGEGAHPRARLPAAAGSALPLIDRRQLLREAREALRRLQARVRPCSLSPSTDEQQAYTAVLMGARPERGRREFLRVGLQSP